MLLQHLTHAMLQTTLDPRATICYSQQLTNALLQPTIDPRATICYSQHLTHVMLQRNMSGYSVTVVCIRFIASVSIAYIVPNDIIRDVIAKIITSLYRVMAHVHIIRTVAEIVRVSVDT